MPNPFETLFAGFPVFEPGTVWLVGAGPGDPGLLTAHAIHALGAADVVVYDALVAPEILALAADHARLEFAGKRGGRPSAKQRDISERLIELARDGHRVLRLKGGDPFVFGRGGEEAAALAARAIPFRVVPGITAGLAALTYAGIPATMRETNHAITLMTGHRAALETTGDGDIERIDWSAFVATRTPLVLYMARGTLPAIVPKLLAAGMAATTPVAFITHATTPSQQCVLSTLDHAVADLASSRLEAPLITVIGRIAGLRDFSPAQD